MICEKCGYDIQIGDFPFCKGGHARGFSNVVGDECDKTIEHGFPTPRRFRSKAEWKRACKEAGIEHSPRYAPPAGTDRPKAGQVTNWNAYPDMRPETLQWLADRLATGKAQKEPALPTLTVRPEIRDLTLQEWEAAL